MKGICHRKERGGARACAAQIAANGVPVNAHQHPKSSPLAFLSTGVANPTPLSAKLSKTRVFQKEVFPNLFKFLNFPPLSGVEWEWSGEGAGMWEPCSMARARRHARGRAGLASGVSGCAERASGLGPAFLARCLLSAVAYSLGAALRKHNVKKSTLGEAGGGAKKKPSAAEGAVQRNSVGLEHRV